MKNHRQLLWCFQFRNRQNEAQSPALPEQARQNILGAPVSKYHLFVEKNQRIIPVIPVFQMVC